MIIIKEVKTRREIKQFVEFPLNLYKDCPYFVPCLYDDEKKLFKKEKLHNEHYDAVYFLAFKDNKVVGRISIINQKDANKKWNTSSARFTRFDSIDDQEVANALFDAGVKWAKEQGLNKIIGPLGFSDLNREGLLVWGFDKITTFESQYSYEYYVKLVENYGFEKDTEWYERRLRMPKVKDERLQKISSLIMKRENLHWVKCKNTKDFIKRYANQFFDMIDETYSHLYGTVPLTDDMKKEALEGFKLIIDMRFLHAIANEKDEIVCFGLGFPSMSKSVHETQGKLWPFGFIKILHEIKHPTVIDLGLVGVKDQYKMKGVASAMFDVIYKGLEMEGIEYCETNLTLEDNLAIQNNWKHFDAEIVRRRISYKKDI